MVAFECSRCGLTMLSKGRATNYQTICTLCSEEINSILVRWMGGDKDIDGGELAETLGISVDALDQRCRRIRKGQQLSRRPACG